MIVSVSTDLTDADIRSLVAEGKELGAMEHAARGQRPGQAAVMPVATPQAWGPPPILCRCRFPLGPAWRRRRRPQEDHVSRGGAAYSTNLAMPQVRIAGPFGMWVLDETTASHEVPTEFGSPSDVLELHGRALALIDGEPAVLKYLSPGSDVQACVRERKAFLGDDPRVLPIPSDASTFPGAVEQMRKVDRTGRPWPAPRGRARNRRRMAHRGASPRPLVVGGAS